MDRDTQFSPDQLGQTRGGPQVGRKAVLGGAVGQPAADDLLLAGRQLARPSGHGLRRQAAGPVLPGGGHPAANAARIDAEDGGHVLGRVPLSNPLDREKPPPLQGCR